MLSPYSSSFSQDLPREIAHASHDNFVRNRRITFTLAAHYDIEKSSFLLPGMAATSQQAERSAKTSAALFPFVCH